MFDRIQAVCQERGREMGVLERLAWLPEGAEPLSPQNHICGFSLRVEDCLLFFLPGVPEEVADLMDRVVLPCLLESFGRAPVFCQRIIKLFGLTESETTARVEGLAGSFPGLEVGSYPFFPEVHLSLTAQGSEEERLEGLLDRAEAWLTQRLGRYIYGRDKESLAGVLGRMLKDGGLTLATAESCTGGRTAQMITSSPGSSAYFIQGVVTYADRAKSELLGVEPDLIRANGAVSPQVAKAMAQGLKHRAGVDLAVSITGIAGPDGGSPEKPVGTVFFGLAADDRTMIEHRRFLGDRERVQAQAAHFALDLVRRHILLTGSGPEKP
jgi:nicotinamide-nucleotide amidase